MLIVSAENERKGVADGKTINKASASVSNVEDERGSGSSTEDNLCTKLTRLFLGLDWISDIKENATYVACLLIPDHRG